MMMMMMMSYDDMMVMMMMMITTTYQRHHHHHHHHHHRHHRHRNLGSVRFLQCKAMVQKWSATGNLITSFKGNIFFTSQVQTVSPTLLYGPKCPVLTSKEVKRRRQVGWAYL